MQLVVEALPFLDVGGRSLVCPVGHAPVLMWASRSFSSRGRCEAVDVFVCFVAVEGKGTLDVAESSLAADRLDDDQ
eukprot:6287436-Prymnesium_polylepis.1